MYICKHCGKQYSQPTNFCGNCGGNSIQQSGSTVYYGNGYAGSGGYSGPAYQNQPQYAQPQYSRPLNVPTGKGATIAGMACGIVAALIGIYLMFGTSVFANSIAYRGTFGYFFFLSLFQIPPTIIGAVLSFKSRGPKAMSIVGIACSLTSAFFWMISFFIALSSL